MGTIKCCLGCDKRTPECHGTCEIYKSQKAENDLIRDIRSWQNEMRYGFYAQRNKGVHRAMKHRRDMKKYGGQ